MDRCKEKRATPIGVNILAGLSIPSAPLRTAPDASKETKEIPDPEPTGLLAVDYSALV